MFDKFEARCRLGNHWSAYRMLREYEERHRERLKRYIQSMPKKLLCQACGGSGSVEIDRVYFSAYEVYPIMGRCGWCEGIGYVTRWERGMWLRYRREEKGSVRWRKSQ